MTWTSIPTTPDKILRAFKAKLLARNDLTGFSEDTLVITQDPAAQIPQTGFVWCSIHMSGGAFRSEEYAGGGSKGLFIDTQIVTEIHSANQLDPAGENSDLLLDATTGLIGRSVGIMQALAIAPEFDLQDEDGNDLVAELLEPLDWQIPPAERGKGVCSLAFRCCFLWDASAPT